jgi:glycerophosphoryl diester phosphodiesterase
VARHPFLEGPQPVAFAHRGGASDAPENTLAAFARAVEMGYRYLETDVHATRDGVLMAFHDPDLRRTCGVEAKIEDLDFADLRDVRVAGTEPIPTLDDVLGTWPDAMVNIDCKSDAAVGPLIARLRSGDALDRTCIGSFSDRRLASIRLEFGARVCTSCGPREIAALRAGSWFGRTGRNAAHAAQVPVRQGPFTILDRRFIESAQRAGLHVHAWTIDDPAEMHRLLDLGVDGIMTDRPSVLLDVLRTRGSWHG